MATVPVPIEHVLAAAAFLKASDEADAVLGEMLFQEAHEQLRLRERHSTLGRELTRSGFRSFGADLVDRLLSCFTEGGLTISEILLNPDFLRLNEAEFDALNSLSAERPAVRLAKIEDERPAFIIESRQAVEDLIPRNGGPEKTVRLLRFRSHGSGGVFFGKAGLQKLSAAELAVAPKGAVLMEAMSASAAGQIIGFETRLMPPRPGTVRDRKMPLFRLHLPDGMDYRAVFRAPPLGAPDIRMPVRLTVDHLLARFFHTGEKPVPIPEEVFGRLAARLPWFGGGAAECLPFLKIGGS